MTSPISIKNAADTPAAILRHLAARAYRMLRNGTPTHRCEVLALLDEIAQVRRTFDPVSTGELLGWFDRLEVEVAGLLDCGDPDAMHPQSDPAHCHGVGVA